MTMFIPVTRMSFNSKDNSFTAAKEVTYINVKTITSFYVNTHWNLVMLGMNPVDSFYIKENLQTLMEMLGED